MSSLVLPAGRKFIQRGVIAGAIAVLLVVLYSLARYPAINDHSAGTVVFGLMVIGLALFYAAFGLWWTRLPSAVHQTVMQLGMVFGLLCGGLWIIELVAGNLMDSTSPAVQLLYRGSTIAVLIVSGIAGYVVARRTNNLSDSVLAGLWNGMISGLITFLALMFITFAFQGSLQANPDTVREVMRGGVSDFASATVSDSLAGAINHLWIGPLIGVICGGIGGAVGINVEQPPIKD